MLHTWILELLGTASTHMVLRLYVVKFEYCKCTKASVSSTNECDEKRPALCTLIGLDRESLRRRLVGFAKASTILGLQVSQ